VDDDFELENPNLAESKFTLPIRYWKFFWIRWPKSACLTLSFFIMLPFVLAIISLQSSPNQSYQSSSAPCDTNLPFEKYFSVETYDAGVVAADDPRCSQIGADILADGGYAMDAAVATALCLGVVSPASSGLGGGCFVLGYNASSKEPIFIDSREVAPKGSSKNMFVNNPSMSLNGGLAVAVPGELKGLHLAWRLQGGGVTWQRIVSPSAVLAQRWVLTPTVENYIHKIESVVKSDPVKYAPILNMFFDSKGNSKQAGDIISNPALSVFLTGIANEGLDYVYGASSRIPEDLAQEINSAGGNITAEEIRLFEPIERDVISMDVMGYRYLGSPPPSSGGLIVGAILKFLEGYEEPLASQNGTHNT
jgi:gamma-glutamyltranspeptidase / glutathione hydrolase / leukotriene-C4 hydrolase